MKKLILFLLVLPLLLSVVAQNKARYDIVQPKLSKTQQGSASTAAPGSELKNATLAATMLPGGYFTAGTTAGNSASPLDDNCQITFGHPYAMTSYPLFSVDGKWYKPDQYFDHPWDMTLGNATDTLAMTGIKAGALNVSFAIYYKAATQKLVFSETITNSDTKTHAIGAGLVWDAGMGQNGDGVAEINGSFITSSQAFAAGSVPSTFSVWEKANGAKGLGVSFTYANNPDKLIAGNWNDLFNSQAPDSFVTAQQAIYDLLLKFYWAEKIIPAGGSTTQSVEMSLLQADFSSPAFLRWDLPLAIAIDNNTPFPKSISSYVQCLKVNDGLGATTLKLTLPNTVTAGITTYTISTSLPAFQSVQLAPAILYENNTAKLTVQLYSGTTLVDELQRNLFIPASPVSDSGLKVTLDTLITARAPFISLKFEVDRTDLGSKVTDLAPGNIFLYEDGTRISNLSMTKDTSSGGNAADIVFALDVTGSMGGIINSVKSNIIEFADSLARSNIDYQLGLVTFLDYVENVYPFTKDVQSFQNTIAAQYAHGGGDAPENSLQALLNASQFNFRPTSRRIVVWITDITYHESDWATTLTRKVVLDSLLAKGIVVDAIGTPTYQTDWYDPIISPTGGTYYDINGNFRDILIDISHIKYLYKYLLSYTSPTPASGTKKGIKLQVRYSGLGGEADTSYGTSAKSTSAKYFACYPNPFNPTITFKVTKGNYTKGQIVIYNILGAKIKTFAIDDQSSQNIPWDARGEAGEKVASGFYLAQLMLTDAQNKVYTETAKILYLK
jgi:Mg-chelatase subunit ChlD